MSETGTCKFCNKGCTHCDKHNEKRCCKCCEDRKENKCKNKLN